jgi:hypothetical protein
MKNLITILSEGMLCILLALFSDTWVYFFVLLSLFLLTSLLKMAPKCSSEGLFGVTNERTLGHISQIKPVHEKSFVHA